MYEIRHAGLKGFGVFATRPIVRGTRIMAEKALLEVKHERDVFAAVKTLSSKNAEWMKSLSGFQREQSPLARVKDLAAYLFATYRTPSTAKASTISEAFNLLRIFRNNNFDIGRGTQALYQDISRLNHSCVPNAQANFNGTADRFTVHSIRGIAENEEVTISYLSETGAMRASRQSELADGYGFPCACGICEEDTARSRRSEEGRASLCQRTIEAVEHFEISDATGEQKVKATLALTEAFIELMESEGIAGRELASAYMSAAEGKAQLGEVVDAEHYARKALEVDEECLGSDSPLFMDSVERMKVLHDRSV